jgi:hypothetical protein
MQTDSSELIEARKQTSKHVPTLAASAKVNTLRVSARI